MDADRSRRWERWVAPPVLAALALLIQGYRFGTTDQTIHLTLLRRLVEPGTLGNDLVAAHADSHASLFWHVQVPLVQLLGWERLDLLYLVVYLAALTTTFALLQRIGETLFDRRWAWVLGPLFLVVFRACPAHVHTFEPSLINRTFCHPLVLYALLMALRGRVVPAAALCGLAFGLHASTASHTLLAVICAGLFDPTQRRRVPMALLGFAICASPLLIMVAYRGGPGSWWVDPEWMHVLRWRMPHHLFPGRWPAGVWAVAAFQLGLVVAAVRFVPDRAVRARCHGVVAGVLLCGPVLGTLVAGPLPVAPLLGLHLWESWILLAVLAYLLAGGMVAQLLSDSRPWCRVCAVVVGVLLLAGGEARLMGLEVERVFRWRAPAGDEAQLVRTLRTVIGPGERLLAPPTGMGWVRPAGALPLYVTVKDGGEVVFDRDMALQWRARLAELCGEDVLAGAPPRGEYLGYRSVGRRADAAFAARDPRELRALALRERAWLLPVPVRDARQGLTPAYVNDAYIVYDLRLPLPEESP